MRSQCKERERENLFASHYHIGYINKYKFQNNRGRLPERHKCLSMLAACVGCPKLRRAAAVLIMSVNNAQLSTLTAHQHRDGVVAVSRRRGIPSASPSLLTPPRAQPRRSFMHAILLRIAIRKNGRCSFEARFCSRLVFSRPPDAIAAYVFAQYFFLSLLAAREARGLCFCPVLFFLSFFLVYSRKVAGMVVHPVFWKRLHRF